MLHKHVKASISSEPSYASVLHSRKGSKRAACQLVKALDAQHQHLEQVPLGARAHGDVDIRAEHLRIGRERTTTLVSAPNASRSPRLHLDVAARAHGTGVCV